MVTRVLEIQVLFIILVFLIQHPLQNYYLSSSSCANLTCFWWLQILNFFIKSELAPFSYNPHKNLVDARFIGKGIRSLLSFKDSKIFMKKHRFYEIDVNFHNSSNKMTFNCSAIVRHFTWIYANVLTKYVDWCTIRWTMSRNILV